MTKETYKERLRAFNATEKYKSEVNFLYKLMDLEWNSTHNGKILDYGCGLGNLVHELVSSGFDAYGYDYVNYREKDDLYRFRQEYFFKFDKVYFMHSLAHIPEPGQKLRELKLLLNPGAKIYVITPNQQWINDIPQHPNYKPDPTVVEHFYLYSLKRLFTDAGYRVVISGQFGEQSSGFCERLFLEATI